jgi:ribosome maturation factor RimP
VERETAVDRIRPLADRVARSHGLELFDLQWRREPVGWVLRVVIDRPLRTDASGTVVVEALEESIGIDECQRVSEDLSALLDVEDVLGEQHYTLEVSSPGLDRPLRGPDDYRRFAGRLAKIVVREAVDGQMHFEGRLLRVEDEVVVLAVGRSKEKRIPLGLVARGRLDVEF